MMRGGILVFTDWELHKDSSSGHREALCCEAFRKRVRVQPAVSGKRTFRMPAYPDGVIFLPALMPMEAVYVPLMMFLRWPGEERNAACAFSTVAWCAMFSPAVVKA